MNELTGLKMDAKDTNYEADRSSAALNAYVGSIYGGPSRRTSNMCSIILGNNSVNAEKVTDSANTFKEAIEIVFGKGERKKQT